MPETLPDTLSPLPLLHACETLLVLDKPEGLLAVPGRGEAGRDNLATRVQAQFGDALVVHRLDQATSGLMLFARGLPMQALLNKAFAERAVHKDYVAVVEGLLAADNGRIDAPLTADWPRRPRQQVDMQRGKPSLTHWSVLARDGPPGTTRLLLKPVTGRSHQLRVHLLHIGHPIRGDNLYAPEPLHAPRLLLHATRLQLRHPISDELLVFNSPVPF